VGKAKDIRIKPISCKDARNIIRTLHYSGKVDTRSSVHLGVFLNGKCGGAIQLGIPLDKHKAIAVIRNTPWNGMLDIHRLAFADWLPRNGESRAIGYMVRWIRKTYPHIQWVQSYADATQCGDGAIYRASGFDLVGIKKNSTMWRLPNGEVIASLVIAQGFGNTSGKSAIKRRLGVRATETSTRYFRRVGAEQLQGFQLRYIKFIDPLARERLTVPVIPFSEIDRLGARMYRGQRPGSVASDALDTQSGEGSATLTPGLKAKKANANG